MPHLDSTSSFPNGQVKSKRECLQEAIHTSPRSSNTGVKSSSNSQNAGKTSKTDYEGEPLPGGHDWFEISLFGCWEASAWDTLRKELDEQKEHAATFASLGKKAFGTVARGDDVMLVSSTGVSGNVACRWAVILPGGIRISIVDRREFLKSRPSVRIIITSEQCMARGSLECYAEARRVLAVFGFIECQEAPVPSRVDLCLDMVDVDTDKVTRDFMAGKTIRRGRKFRALGDEQNPESGLQLHGDGNVMTGFNVGKRGKDCAYLRVYDKSKEVKAGSDKERILIARRWGGVRPEKAIRIEFELRGSWLRKRYGIKTLAEYLDKEADIIEYLVSDHFRMTKEVVDKKNKNHQRATVSKFWKSVQAGFASAFGEARFARLTPIKRFASCTEALQIQAAGCLSSALARLGVEIESMGEPGAMRAVHGLLHPMLERIVDCTVSKRRLFEVLSAIGPPDDPDLAPF